ncbi:hypothetical protein [Barnesiella viscericola]|uniref:hypothetical protein n=1 Tax=Barnesiella viscericola TaxID=397865 RepID=UPI0024B7C793|nr:hypothetical protein [Barnesiella viscericola]
MDKALGRVVDKEVKTGFEPDLILEENDFTYIVRQRTARWEFFVEERKRVDVRIVYVSTHIGSYPKIIIRIFGYAIDGTVAECMRLCSP